VNARLNALRMPGRLPPIVTDRVIAAMVAGIALLAAVNSQQAVESLWFIGRALVHIAPFFLLAIPLISGLLQLGMAPGAALAFAAAGAASSIPAALAVYALVKRTVFFVYLAIGLVGSLTAGYLYQLVLAL
jgi:uncharacterized membrane protein YraQ (UPF0718 family)